MNLVGWNSRRKHYIKTVSSEDMQKYYQKMMECFGNGAVQFFMQAIETFYK